MDIDDLYHVVVDAVHNGYGRFEGVHHAQMNKKGSFQCPEEWIDFLHQEDVYMTFDQLAGEIVVYYADDEPDLELDEFQRVYQNIASRLKGLGVSLHHNAISPFPYIYPFKRFSESGRACINPFVVRGPYTLPIPEGEQGEERHPFDEYLKSRVRHVLSSEAQIADEPIDVVIEGRGHYFTIAKADGGWALDQSKPDWKKSFRFLQYYSVYHLIESVRRPLKFSAFQRELLKDPPSDPEQSQTGQPSGGVSGAPLPK